MASKKSCRKDYSIIKCLRFNFRTCLEETRAARIPVIVVPMFAPSVIGSMTSRVIMSKPARGVRTEVVIEEDWRKGERKSEQF